MKRRWSFILAILAIVSISLFIFRGAILSNIAAKVVLKAGKPMRFGDYTVFIERIEGDKLLGIKINGNNRRLEAKSGDYQYNFNEKLLKFNLIEGIAEDANPDNPKQFRRLTFKQISMKIRLKESDLKHGGILSSRSF